MDDDGNNSNSVDVGDDDREEDDDEVVDEEDQEEGAGDGAGSNQPVIQINAVPNLDSLYGLREIGREALCWQLSSAKPGNGVEQIRDQSTDTYWQSDGVSQPHWIQVHFGRRVALSHVCLYLDYNLDESYTPKHLSIQVGMTTQDLVPAIYPANTLVELNEPIGWCIIPLMAAPDPLDEIEDPASTEQSRSRRIVRTHLIQISVISMHQNGRDTHIRQVQLYGPRTAAGFPAFRDESEDLTVSTSELKRRHIDEEFSSIPMSQYSVIR